MDHIPQEVTSDENALKPWKRPLKGKALAEITEAAHYVKLDTPIIVPGLRVVISFSLSIPTNGKVPSENPCNSRRT
jgi:hypothetical protein